MPLSWVRPELFAEVTIDEVGERRHRGIRLRAIGANRDRRSLADAQRQDIEDALGVANEAVLHNFDARVFEASGRLHEERGRARMESDLVHDGQTAFGYDGIVLPLRRSLRPATHSVKHACRMADPRRRLRP